MPASGLNKQNNPWLWVPSLYLIEGIPNALVVTVAVVMLKSLGLDNGLVALYTSLFYLPWVIKPLWSPLVDMFSTKRKWIVGMQLVLAAGLAMIAFSLSFSFWLSLSLTGFWITALASATHDIAADGYYLLALNQKQQAFFVGIRSTFYRLATLLASGGVVFMAGHLMKSGLDVKTSWQLTISALSLLFALASVWHLLSLPKLRQQSDETGDSKDFLKAFKSFFERPDIIASLAFMLFYRLPEALLSKMIQPFLLDPREQGGLELSVQQVGLANGTFGVIGIVLGGIVGGFTISRVGLRKCLWPMALALTLPSTFYCYLAAVQPSAMTLICCGIAIEQFGYGFGFTAYMMYLMVYAKGGRFTASHYAFCTGFMALGLMVPGLIAGHVQLALGYRHFFTLVIILSAATFAVTEVIRRRV